MKLLLALLLIGLPAKAAPLPGAARPELYQPLLAGKRIGLVVNQASVHGGQHTIDALLARGLRVVKLYALEHGVRGEGGAGEEIGDSVDGPTGLPIVSLYGARKKPDAAALRGVDLLVYDVQDVGVRFFTYISSLGLIMEAAAEHGLPVVVFDRPNPNGDYVDGPLLKPGNKSFVGAFPIPLVYGMTAGELARMIHGEGWQKTRGLSLRVVPVAGYEHAMVVAPEVRPSPGLRSLQAIRIYPSLALFEPTVISVGRGTEQPYAAYGLPEPGFGAYRFTPRFGAKGGLYDGELCFGEEFFSRPVAAVPRFTTDIFAKALARAHRRPFVLNARFLRLLVGDNRVVSQLLAGRPYAEIRRGFAGELAEFRRKRAKYLLYK